MTRINCLPVCGLHRKALVAEYRELPRVRHAWPRKKLPKIPPSYRMGEGHETFFYDKGIWLMRRHRELIAEMKRRGYKHNLPPLDLAHWPTEAMNDWEPDEEALEINRQRISERNYS